MTEPRYLVHTDGGCRPNPGPGGWGAVIDAPDGRRHELSGGDAESTNNRMELTAALRALESLPEGAEVDLVTDSTYVKDGITKWLAGWRRNGWMTSTKEPVRNRDLWIALDAAARQHRVHWRWARGHAGTEGNERAHELAAAAIPASAKKTSVARASARTSTSPATASPAAGLPRTRSEEEPIEVWIAVVPGPREGGAWGAVMCLRDVARERSGRIPLGTPNALHVASAAHALELIKGTRPVRVVTVSDYLRDGASLWLTSWRERGWKTREGKPVANRPLWERLAAQLERLEVTFEVAGKTPVPPELERARELAKRALAG